MRTRGGQELGSITKVHVTGNGGGQRGGPEIYPVPPTLHETSEWDLFCLPSYQATTTTKPAVNHISSTTSACYRLTSTLRRGCTVPRWMRFYLCRNAKSRTTFSLAEFDGCYDSPDPPLRRPATLSCLLLGKHGAEGQGISQRGVQHGPRSAEQ